MFWGSPALPRRTQHRLAEQQMPCLPVGPSSLTHAPARSLVPLPGSYWPSEGMLSERQDVEGLGHLASRCAQACGALLRGAFRRQAHEPRLSPSEGRVL